MAPISSPAKYEVISESSDQQKRKSKTENYHDNGNCLMCVCLYFRYISLVNSQM